MSARADLAHRIISQQFRTSKYAGRYDLGDVDAFLDDLSQQVRAGVPGGEIARAAVKSRFKMTAWFRVGYLVDGVDDFIDELVQQLRSLPEGSPQRDD